MSEPEVRSWRWVVWAVLFSAAVFAALFAVGWRNNSPRRLLDAELARLRAAGYATTLAEWNSGAPPDDQNGAAAIDAADRWLLATVGPAAGWKAPGPWRSDLPERWWDGLDAEQGEELDRFLAAARPYFEQVAAALDSPRVRWEATFGASSMFDEAKVRRLQRLTRLHQAWARRAASDDDRIRAIRARLRLAHRTEHTTLITGMVLVACARSAAVDVRDALADRSVPAADARRELDGELRLSMTDRVPGLVRAEIVQWAGLTTGLVDGRLRDIDGVPLMDLDSVANRLMSWLWFGGPDDLFRALQQAAEVRAPRYAERRRAYVEIERTAPKFAEIASLIWPIVARKAARTDALLRLARIALAAIELRETTGAWPASLDDLRAAFPEGVPTDPFTDAPFAYEIRGRALRIASAGRCDDQPAVSEADLVEDGLVWTIER